MEGVIPNSKVVIIPPRDATRDDWRRELYLRPGEWIPWVTLTVVVATVGLAVIVFVLHLNEKVRVYVSFENPHIVTCPCSFICSFVLSSWNRYAFIFTNACVHSAAGGRVGA